MSATDDRAKQLEEGEEPFHDEQERSITDDVAKILIVDDDERNLFALERVLEELGEEIVAVRSGEEALRRLLREDFAVILLDVLMPGLDGYETASMIRQRERSRHIPIIFLTAINKDEVHMFRGYSAGAVDYVFKPVEPFILRSKVAVFVDLFKKTQEIRRSAAQERTLLSENLRARTEKMLAEQALRRSEERQALIIESLPIALYAMDFSEKAPGIRLMSGNTEGICGFPSARFEEDPEIWASRIHPEDRGRVLREFGRLGAAGSFAIEYQWRCADDAYRCFLDQAVLVRDDHGKPKEIFGTWLDVTERRRLEQQLVHAHKMEAIGQLTGGIAHDFNNMLTVVIGSLDRLHRSLQDDKRAANRIEMALQGALRCSDLTQRLLAFARRQPLQPQALNLNELVPRMAGMLRRTLGEMIEIEIRPAPQLWIAWADPSQVESVLVNLVINARDAMLDGGTLTIETGNVSVSEAFAAQEPDLLPGDYVMLTIRDTGTGIPPELLDRVFEPFFTTKDTGRGTGLGLSITYGFVKQSGGHIKIDSQPGRGTTIQVYLPRGTASGTTERDRHAADFTVPRAHDGEVVLTVEDDQEVRNLAVSILQELGYTVLEAENGRVALHILDEQGPVHLLFTDVVMSGGLSGPDLAAEAIKRRPDLKVLFTSAYAGQFVKESTLPNQGRLLRKPYRDHEMACAIRSALDG
ncbi:response regulator [Rhodospirillaceae bacterium SYSU D60014]|uniref:response regulator n=1 Tax=Virgifigura deserti TaxID=2268457 RepID=UPI000E66D7AD